MQLYFPLWKNDDRSDINKPERDTRAEKNIIPTHERGGDVYNSDPCPSQKEKEEEIKKLFENVEHEEPEFCPYCGQELECSDGFVRCWDCGIIFHECEKTIDEQLEDCLEEGLGDYCL